MTGILRAALGEHWNQGRDVELVGNSADGFALEAGLQLRADCRYTVDEYGRVVETGDRRLRIITREGVILDLAR